MTALGGRVVVVTGASRGLGRSMAARFAREGAHVVPTARSRDAIEELAAEAATEMLPVTADVRDEDDVQRVVESAVDRFGRLDGLVNNAAVGLLSLQSELKDVEEISREEWQTVVETNLTGPFLFTKHALPALRDGDGGHVVNVSSGYGRRGAAGWAPYVSSKHGLEGLTETVALENEDEGVTANAILPGGSVETGFWDTEEKLSHLRPSARDEVQSPDVLNDAVTALLAQGPDGVTGESMRAPAWEERLDV
ncbi:MAG: SDR family NAD(P)-dependent oxidoreductase [Halobacteriaceae archaeon]